MNLERWHALMSQWGVPDSDATFSDLLSAYSESHRHYHNATHIDDCLAQFDRAASLAEQPHEVEIALWFHDAIYQPTSSRNEQKSAEWASRFLISVGAPEERSDRVSKHILATVHAADTADDTALVVDVDLSILGRAPSDFERYEKAIREEYKWVPGPLFRRKRIAILQSFLDRPVIYGTDYFRELYETQARVNLEWAIECLRK